MALFRDLARTIAEAEGLSEMTVIGIGQYLRDAGLISKHGRGRAAARMTVSDAANLLIAVNACDLAKDAVEVVQKYSVLKLPPYPVKKTDSQILGSIFADGNTLGQAIGSVLEFFVPDIDGQLPFRRAFERSDVKVEIGFGRPSPAAFISFAFENPPSPINPFKWLQYDDVIAFGHFWNWSSVWSVGAGRKDLTVIGKDTLSKVGSVLAS